MSALYVILYVPYSQGSYDQPMLGHVTHLWSAGQDSLHPDLFQQRGIKILSPLEEASNISVKLEATLDVLEKPNLLLNKD
jgi:hypothetical protein